jgi:hypothetical protein
VRISRIIWGSVNEGTGIYTPRGQVFGFLK